MAEGVAKEAIEKIHSKLECSICLEPYKQPKLLPCFHTFCKSPCLEELVKRDHHGNTSLCCPACCYVVALTERGVAGLQADFHVDHLVEIRDFLDRAQHTSESQCEKCTKAPAEGFCRDCQKLVCAKCIEVHSTWVEIADHKIVSLTEVTAEASKMISPTKKVPHCSRHTETALKLFCSTCSELICMDCTVRLHKDHNYDLVDDLFDQHKAEIASGLKPVRENIERVNRTMVDFDTTARAIGNQRAQVEADIHKEIDELHHYLNQRRGELIGRLDVLIQQKRKALAAQRDQVEVTLAKYTSCLEYAEGGLETGTPAEVVAMKGQVLKRISEITDKFNPATIQPEVDASVVLVADGKEEIVKACQEMSVKMVAAEFSVEGMDGVVVGGSAVVVDLIPKSNLRVVNVTAELVHVKSRSVTVVKVEKKEDNKHTLSFTPNMRGRHELGVCVHGHPIKGSPFPLSVAANLGKPTRVITGLNRPWGVVTNSRGHTIVVENGSHQVTVYDKQWRKVSSFGSQGSNDGQLYYPCGLTVDGEDNIYVADRSNNRIQKFSPDGKFLASTDKSNVQFVYPQGVGYNKTNGKIYVSSCHKVQILSSDLTLYRSFGKEGKRDGEFNVPTGIAFDVVGNVFVCDEDNKRVQIFTADGLFTRKLDKTGQLNSPGDVAVCNTTGMVYVTELSGHCISIFTDTGRFIRSFGTKGANNGQFNGPSGIAIDDDENIIVADYWNKRLQIF